MNENCSWNDSGNEILNKIIESDAIIFASPVYYNVSAQLKIMIDRFYAKTYKITDRNLKAGVIMTAWNNDDWTYGAIINTLIYYLIICNLKILEEFMGKVVVILL